MNDVSRDSGKGLSTKALIEAISVNKGDICRDESAMADVFDILRWCSSFVRKTAESDGIEITVKEFLLEIDPAVTPDIARYRQYEPAAYEELAITSLVYLSFSDFSTTDPEEFVRVTAFPFWDRAARNWSSYCRAFTHSEPLEEQAGEFFDPSTSP